ncbi:MAG: ribosome biogenesis/translation initiation ATPase RLI [Candidatus Helarchaeales archaeon]
MKNVRIGVITTDKCKPNECRIASQKPPCIKFCPVVRSGAEAIIFDEDEMDHPRIVENVCTGCGICVKKCPYKAITISNIAEELKTDFTHRYVVGGFVLFRMPIVKPGKIVGLIGPNGIGKTTVIKILAGELKPNLGRPGDAPDWDEIIRYYRGSELQNYFTSLSRGEIKLAAKPQYITKLPDVVKGVAGALLEKVDERGCMKDLIKSLALEEFLDRELSVLSGGELQRIAIAAVVERDADVYFFDEPSSFLDIKERLEVAKVLHELADIGKTVVIVEHDLAICDYLSDFVHILYGQPGAYGIVSHIHGVREGINMYLEGFLPDENVRFREEPIVFHLNPTASEGWDGMELVAQYPKIEKSIDNFKLSFEGGKIYKGEVVGIVGENGLGKTTLIRLLGGELSPDDGFELPKLDLKIAIKPQYLKPEYDGTVEQYLLEVAGKAYRTSLYKTEILMPFNLLSIEDRYLNELSGGELQKVEIARTLSTPADLYLFDEPSAYIDSQSRLSITKAIKRNIQNKHATAFIVEHDILCVDFLSDRLIVFTGEPGRNGIAYPPIDLKDGMNLFLKHVDITFRRDPRTGRPRINKYGSELDRKQKASGDYYYISKKGEK